MGPSAQWGLLWVHCLQEEADTLFHTHIDGWSSSVMKFCPYVKWAGRSVLVSVMSCVWKCSRLEEDYEWLRCHVVVIRCSLPRIEPKKGRSSCGCSERHTLVRAIFWIWSPVWHNLIRDGPMRSTVKRPCVWCGPLWSRYLLAVIEIKRKDFGHCMWICRHSNYVCSDFWKLDVHFGCSAQTFYVNNLVFFVFEVIISLCWVSWPHKPSWHWQQDLMTWKQLWSTC